MQQKIGDLYYQFQALSSQDTYVPFTNIITLSIGASNTISAISTRSTLLFQDGMIYRFKVQFGTGLFQKAKYVLITKNGDIRTIRIQFSGCQQCSYY